MRVGTVLSFAVLSLVVGTQLAHAASGGGALPWDSTFNTFATDLTGPTAFNFAKMGIVAVSIGAIFAWNHLGEVMRGLAVVCGIGALLTGVDTLMGAINITGAIL